MPDARRSASALGTALAASLLTLTVAGVAPAEEPVDVNAASASELASGLHGVGASRAEAIVEHRDAEGPFDDVEELVEVSGIGPATLEDNRDRIRTGDGEE